MSLKTTKSNFIHRVCAKAGPWRPKRDVNSWSDGLVARPVGALFPDEVRRVHLGA